MKKWIQQHRILSALLIPVIAVGAFAGQFVYANVLTAGYCWNGDIGWVNMAGVDLDLDTRTFTGSASYDDGKYASGLFPDGEIDFTTQGGTQLGLTLSSSMNAGGNFPILGQAFSNEIGWIFANHGGTAGTEAAVMPNGELTGNFWSNEFGWIQCDAASIGAGNTQVWDLADIIVSEASLIIAENAGTNTFTVRLGSQPATDVVIDLSSNNTGEATVSPATMTFTNANWNTVQTATVTGVDDAIIANDTATITVAVDDAASDNQYDTLANETVAIMLTDDDVASIVIDPANITATGLTILENAGTGTFNVRLGTQPATDVVIDLTSNNTSEATVAPASLTFTNGNWNTNQTVTVTGVNDDIDRDDSTTLGIAVNDAASDDTYDGVSDETAPITITDDDTAGFSISTAALTVPENVGTNTYTIILDTEPTSDVVIDLASDDTNEGTVAPASLTFTNTNWNSAQTVTVTGVDDVVVSTDTANITAIINDTASADEFDALADQIVAVTFTNDDVATIVIDTTGITTTGITVLENAGTEDFNVRLGTQPATDVVVDFVSNDTNEATVASASLTFTNTNWNIDQTVTVTGVNDDIDRDDATTITISINDAASDNTYDAVPDTDGIITITDDDTAGITVSAISGDTSEAGGTATFTAALNTQPSDDVVIPFSSSDTSEGTVAPSTLIFTDVNWNTPQTVTVTGVDDAIGDGTITYSIINAAAVSTDAVYGGLNAADINVNNTDDESTILDTDGDGVPDSVELSDVPPTDPNDATDFTDTDGDGVPDYVEINGTPPTSPTDPNDFTDTDGDGVPDYVEINGTPATDPNDGTDFTDSDNDGVPDYVETEIDGTNPNDPNSVLDDDGDGVPNYRENQGFNAGDANGDGTPDRTQQSVSGALNPVTGTNTTLQASGTCTFITENAFLAEGTLTTQDPTSDYPVGLIDFQVSCTNPGESSDVTIYYSEQYDTSTWSYKKFDGNGNVYSDITDLVTFGTHTYTTGPETGTTVTTVSFTVTDGDPRTDEDGIADGIINDPSGPAVPVVISSESSGGSSSGNRRYCNDPTASNYESDGTGRGTDAVCKYDQDEQEIQETIAENTTNLSCPYFTQYMRTGDQGDNVKTVQAFMQTKGHYTGPLDGVFGTDLDQSVRAFQNANHERILQPWGIAPGGGTGYLYQSTRAHMNIMSGCDVCVTLDNGQRVGCDAPDAAVPAAPLVAPVTVSNPVADTCSFTQARPGEDNDNVAKIQTFLNQQGFMDFPATGYYGQITQDAVRAFQTANPSIYQNVGLTEPSDWFYAGSVQKAQAICTGR